MIVYQLWLYDLKMRLAISDNLRDEILINYLEVAHRNLWTLYYRFDLINEEVPHNHKWYGDTVTKMAVLHLAATYYLNPDINMESRNVVNDRMVILIIGSRMRY